MRRSSPGALASVHQRESKLNGPNDCSACHGGIFGTLREACLECHEAVEEQLAEPSGLHGTLGPRAEQCGLCHGEHHGTATALVHRQSFALAGVRDPEAFDHALVGFIMDGAHLPLDCTECHANARTAVLEAGQHRFLGLDQDCATCHEDVHEGRFALSCASCHGQSTWDGLHSLGHEEFLPLVGGHALACTECHGEGTKHALDIVGGPDFVGGIRRRPPARTCVDCHESPHREEFVGGVAKLVGEAPGASCATCHAADHESFHERELLAMTPELHAASGFPLAEPHQEVACRDCHAVEPRDFAARFPGRSADACSVCHADPHGGQFAEGPFSQGDCLACHERTHFEPHAFTVEDHARTALVLDGKHATTDCDGCHEKPAEDAPRVFRGTDTQCDGCHQDAHAGFFAKLTKGAAPAHGDCERCHDAQSFAGAEKGFEHARWTGFAVEGAHAEAACTVCHALAAEPDATGRRFGRVHELFGAFTGCATCHADPHGGRFDDDELPASVAGRGDCARCHTDSSWRAQVRDFDHGYWTGFALFEEHGSAGCAACHAPLPGSTDDGRTVAMADGAGCADCHEDPHAGQFVEDGASDCQRCHDDEYEDFLSFDHERDARFALGEAHIDLACSACHFEEPRDGVALVRYRPLGTECVDCHGKNAEVLLRRKPRTR
jgi:hypothetical protein